MLREILMCALCLSGSICAGNSENLSLKGGSSYYDLGKFNSIVWDYIKWDNDKGYSVIDPDLMDDFFSSICSEMKAVNMNQIYLSFAQLSSLNCYYDNDFETEPVSPNDIIGVQMKVFKDAQIAGTMDPSLNYLQMLVDGFHKYGIKVNLAFGGGDATTSDFAVDDTSAEKLATVMKNYGIDGADFDIEIVLPEDSLAALKVFFSDFRTNAADKQLTITVMMGIKDWPEGSLKPLFDDFNELFDGVNLMAYSDDDYYLDASNVSWGATSWIDVVGKGNAYKLCFGFFDLVPYEKTDPRSERGAKAADAYLKMISDLQALNYPTNFRAPFWWPAEDDSYKHYTPEKDGSVEFISADQEEFYKELEESL